jgi:hypothetical protein
MSDEQKRDSLLLHCGCNYVGHLFEIGKFDCDDDYYVTITLDHYLPWYKRVMLGVQYIFGRKPHNMMFMEMWFSRQQLDDISKFIQEGKNDSI